MLYILSLVGISIRVVQPRNCSRLAPFDSMWMVKYTDKDLGDNRSHLGNMQSHSTMSHAECNTHPNWYSQSKKLK